MKILFCLDDFPLVGGSSAAELCFNLAQAMQKMGHQVFVISTSQKSLENSLIFQNIELEEFEGIKVWRIYTHYHQRWQSYLSLYNPQTVFRVKKIIQEIKPQVVHFQHIHRYISYHCFKIAKQSGAATFLTAHDVMLFHYGKLIEFINQDNLSIPKEFHYRVTLGQQIKRFKKRYNPFRNLIIRYYLKYINKIFAVSQELKKALNDNDISNIEVIYNGINVNDWSINQPKLEQFKEKYNLKNKKIIFFGGRLSGPKGGEKIILAMKKVIQEIPEAVLLIAGKKNNYIQKMLSLAEEIGLKEQIIFTGWLNLDELKSAYWNSHLVIIPSICSDSFPTINLEAMAAKKPVVATCFGGSPEIVQDGITGFIVNPFNINLMAERIIDLLKNPQKAKQFGQAGYQRVKNNFSLEQQVEQTLNWYKKFCL